jgi:CubicO group peptidase (beta-lactamase class C family)
LPVTSTVAISASPQVVDIQEAPPRTPTNLVPSATPDATSTVVDSASLTISTPNSSERLFQYEPIDRVTFTSIRSQGLFSEDIQAAFTGILTSEFLTLQEKKGISVAVYQNGKLWSRALGFASQKEAMETVTPVGVKSSSKTFLSALILIQIDDGLYELSDRISTLLSDHQGYQS